MQDLIYEPPRGYLCTPRAGVFLGMSGRTLEKHRTYGTGPRFSKLGGKVVYKIDDLKEWADSAARASTADPGFGEIISTTQSHSLHTQRYGGYSRRGSWGR